MKRLLLLAGAAALCTLALFAVYCADVKFDNPLDEKEQGAGTGYEWLWNMEPADCQDLTAKDGNTILGPNCVDYIRNTYFDPGLDTNIRKQWDTKLACAGQDVLKIELNLSHYPASVELNTNQISEFQRLTNPPWDDVVKYTTGADVRVKLLLNGTTEYTLPPGTLMPPPGIYIIRYTADKKKCGSDDPLPSEFEDRSLRVTQFVGDDTIMPVITFCAEWKDTIEVVGSFNTSCAQTNTANGSVLTASGTVNTAVVGSYPITYTACKTLVIGGVPNPAPTCVSESKTVTVIDPPPTGDFPTPVIVLSKYTYNIDGRQFSSPDTGFGASGALIEKGGNGVESAYYVKEGVQDPIPIATNLVTRAPLPAFTDANDNGNDVLYSLAAESGTYKEGSVSRKVYITEPCEAPSALGIEFRSKSGGNISTDSALTFSSTITPAALRDSLTRSFRGTNESDNGELIGKRSYKFGIDFGTLNPDNPQANQYRITYIVLGRCAGGGAGGLRFLRSVERTVIITP